MSYADQPSSSMPAVIGPSVAALLSAGSCARQRCIYRPVVAPGITRLMSPTEFVQGMERYELPLHNVLKSIRSNVKVI